METGTEETKGMPTFVQSGQTWTVTVQYGAHKIRKIEMDNDGTAMSCALYHQQRYTCSITCSGNLRKPEGHSYSSPYCIKWCRT